MAGKIRNMVNRSGRYHARLVVPKDLRGIVGKTELRKPLGGDYRQALRLLPGAVAELQHQIALAERKSGQTPNAAPRYPLAPDQMALSLYNQRLAFDSELRNDPRYAAVGIDDVLVQRLRYASAGKASDEELSELVGDHIDRFRAAGNLSAERGSYEWREVARALCTAELEALSRVAEYDEGDFSGKPTNPLIANAQLPEKPQKAVNLTQLWSDYVASRVQAGFMRDGGKRQKPVIENLRAYLKHNDANKIVRKDFLGWRDHLMKSLSAKTVNDVYLSTVRSLFTWAVENERLSKNVAAGVKQAKPRKVRSREKGYTDAEAVRVLKASRAYQAKPDQFGYVRETPQLVAAKRWVPILCAFSGARVSEICQMHVSDVRQEQGRWIIRIRPDAGTVKAGDYRDVPIHRQIIKLGFVEFVKSIGQGPLFHRGQKPEEYEAKAKRMGNQLATWLRTSGITPVGVQPNHAWRHRVKTQCLELGIPLRTFDAMQGHAAKTAGDNYGDVTLATKIKAIDLLPEYDIW